VALLIDLIRAKTTNFEQRFDVVARLGTNGDYISGTMGGRSSDLLEKLESMVDSQQKDGVHGDVEPNCTTRR
jgi:hypothetical protein